MRRDFPAVVKLLGGRSIVFTATGAAKDTASAAVQAALVRLLASVPPGRLRLTFVDPIGLGQNAAPFMLLGDHGPELITSRAWTEPHHIEARLSELTEHMEHVIQKYLRDVYADIEDYNRHAGEVAEPYRILAVFDFPANFSPTAARRLVSIAQQGPRCGVYTLLVVDTAQPPPHGFTVDEVTRVSTVIAAHNGSFAFADDDLSALGLALERLPDSDVDENVIRVVAERAQGASKVEVPFARISPPPEAWWTASAEDGLSVPLGLSGAYRTQPFELGGTTAVHGLVIGRTGSGKSTLLHVLITNLALHYSPDEIELYLVDFKEGIEFKLYANHGLPHARVISVESEREFGVSVLEGLDAEIERRGRIFRDSNVANLKAFRQATGQPLRRILLVVDEYQVLFAEDDALSARAAQLLDRLVRQGRAFGIHLLLGSQSLAGATALARSTVNQMAVRIAMQSSEDDARLIFADDNPAARLLSRPGEAIYNASNGLIEGNSPFQCAWLDRETHESLLAAVHERARLTPFARESELIVFEGNAPSDIAKNRLLRERLAARGAPAGPPEAWLGEPVAIRPPLAVRFAHQSGCNLLVVGRNVDLATGMLAALTVSLAAGVNLPAAASADPPPIHILSFGASEGDEREVLVEVAGAFPAHVRHGRRRQVEAVIGWLRGELDARSVDDRSPTSRSPLFLIVHGLHAARDLFASDDFGFSLGTTDAGSPAPTVAERFADLLRLGPEAGIHVVMWSNTMVGVEKALGRRGLREVALRVALQMSADDSANLIDSPAASRLGPNRAFLYHEEEGALLKFRPYSPPSTEWLRAAEEEMGRRATYR